VRIGVLALQGAFREHILLFEALGVDAEAVRLRDHLADLDGLVVPGGESTAIGKLMDTYGFYEPIRERHAAGMAVWGTCAGAVLLAREVVGGATDQPTLDLMDLDVQGLDASFPGVFIRAPWIEAAGEDVDVMAEHDGHAVAARQGSLMITAFHPELTGDTRMHRLFLEEIVGASGAVIRRP
jgi:5'-phosphate synthase pdxT subunit